MMFLICYILSLLEETEVKFGRDEKFVPMNSFLNDTSFLNNNRMESEMRLWILWPTKCMYNFPERDENLECN